MKDKPRIFLIADEYLNGGWIRSHVDGDWLVVSYHVKEK